MVFTFYKFWVYIIFLFNRILQTLCNPWFGKKFQFFFVKLFKWCMCFYNRLSILGRYWLIEKLISLFSMHKICSQSVWSKSEIDLLLSNFLQSCPNILHFAAVIFEKKSFKKISCGRSSENVEVTLSYSISFTVEFEKILSIK